MRRMVLALAGMMAVGALPARATEPSVPETVAGAFNETCRRGFPNLDTIARHAAATGWIERRSRLVAEASDPRARNMAPPRFLQKDGFTLILMAPSVLSPGRSCSVSLRVGKDVDTARLAGAVSATLGAGPPTMVKVRKAEQAQWRPSPALVVHASVGSGGAVRTADISVRSGS